MTLRQADDLLEPTVKAFCSYSHRDNASFANTVTHLVGDLRALYEAETGRRLELFFDRESIGWGEDLREAIGTSVENATFFIPIVTATYFRRPWCRDEILSFYGKCQTLGVTELILPIVLAGLPQIRQDSEDEVVRIVARVRFADWTEIWPHGRGSPEWNIGLRRLVDALVQLHQRVESRLAVRALGKEDRLDPDVKLEDDPQVEGSQVDDEEPRISKSAASALASATSVVNDFQQLLSDLNSAFDELEPVDEHAMRSSLDRLGAAVQDRGHQVQRAAREALEQMVEFDALLRGLIRSNRLVSSPARLRTVENELDQVRTVASSLTEKIHGLNMNAEVLRRFADISLGLRVALAPVRAAFQSIRDIGNILSGWVSLEL